jgi:DNA-directed RNA polymerase specialized sigma24 family protein
VERASEYQNKKEIPIRRVTAYQSHIQDWCHRIFADDPALAQQVAQQALARLLDQLGKQQVDKLGPWIYLTALNSCLQRIARARAADIPRTANPAHAPEANELPWLQGIRIINGLHDQPRIGIKLKDLRGFSYEEIARVTRHPVNEVHNYVADGRRDFLMKWDKLRKLGDKKVQRAQKVSIVELEKELKVIFPFIRAEISECPDEAKLLHFFEGSLSAADSKTVNKHIQVCGICDLLLHEVADFKMEEDVAARPIEEEPVQERAAAAAQAKPLTPPAEAAAKPIFQPSTAVPESKPAAMASASAQASASARPIPPETPTVAPAAMPEPVKPPVVVREEVDDVDAAIAAAVRASGPVHKRPTDATPHDPSQPPESSTMIWWGLAALLSLIFLGLAIYLLRH